MTTPQHQFDLAESTLQHFNQVDDRIEQMESVNPALTALRSRFKRLLQQQANEAWKRLIDDNLKREAGL